MAPVWPDNMGVLLRLVNFHEFRAQHLLNFMNYLRTMKCDWCFGRSSQSFSAKIYTLDISKGDGLCRKTNTQ